MSYFCTSCGNEFSKWAGQCPACKEWNTIKEFKNIKKNNIRSTSNKSSLFTKKEKTKKIQTNISEFDRTVGGGIVEDAFVLLSGDPGVGKSTLALQVLLNIAQSHRVIYFSGEESVSQITDRASRIMNHDTTQIKENFQLSSENNLENIITELEKNNFDFVVIDSIQTIFSEKIPSITGSSTQIKYCTENLMYYLKQKAIACILIGHVTKDGGFAGPQTLAHLVDCVLYLEGDKYHQFKVLRSKKNRFGSTSEVGIFEMKENGLQEIVNPSEAFLAGRLEQAEGSVVIPTMEGTRPFLIELQALCSWSHFGYPKRTASGIDLNRMHLMIAVLQKHGLQKLDNLDIFINVVGGFKLAEPAVDLGILMAIAASKQKKCLSSDTVVFGEVGLSGEIRAVNNVEKRLKEADRLGFKKVIMPPSPQVQSKLKLIFVKTIKEALEKIS